MQNNKIDINKEKSNFLIALIKTYQNILSPDHSFWAKGRLPYCKHIPSCSDYMIESINKKGNIKGVYHGVKRILRCNPWSLGGYDPVEKEKEKEKEKKR